LRRLLYSVMTDAGFRGIPEEWWHFSIGDQEWAFQTSATAAVYGPAERPVQ
jgi:D-alanyl-D-alanine dipeptidase